MKLTLDLEIKKLDYEKLATVYYPNEGSKIVFNRGLSCLELLDAFFHEIGHIIDWYLLNSCQGEKQERENNADDIAHELVLYYQKFSEARNEH